MTRLTPREQEILVELAMGHDGHKIIARRLGISKHTLDIHLQNIYAKTGCNNPVQLVRWAFREALLAAKPVVIVVRKRGRISRRMEKWLNDDKTPAQSLNST